MFWFGEDGHGSDESTLRCLRLRLEANWTCGRHAHVQLFQTGRVLYEEPRGVSLCGQWNGIYTYICVANGIYTWVCVANRIYTLYFRAKGSELARPMEYIHELVWPMKYIHNLVWPMEYIHDLVWPMEYVHELVWPMEYIQTLCSRRLKGTGLAGYGQHAYRPCC